MDTTSEASDPVGRLLFGGTRRAVLSVLLGAPDRTVYLRELARIVGGSPGAVQREVRALTAAGLLSREVCGNQVHYRANRVCPAFEPLRTLVVRTMGVAELVRAALVPLASRIDAAYLFGSMAAGTAGPSSDVDVLVIGEAELGEVGDALAAIEEEAGREVNALAYSRADVARRLAARQHLLTSIVRGARVQILGSTDELARLAGQPMAAASRNEPGRNSRPAATSGSGAGRRRNRKP